MKTLRQRITTTVTAFLAVATLTGCLSDIHESSIAEIPSLSNAELCATYATWRKYEGEDIKTAKNKFYKRNIERAIAYGKAIDRRQLISNADYGYVYSGKIAIGMSECAMLAVMGTPNDTNITVTAYGTDGQYVFCKGGTYSGTNVCTESTYVYTENGKVTSWQF